MYMNKIQTVFFALTLAKDRGLDTIGFFLDSLEIIEAIMGNWISGSWYFGHF